MNEEIKTLQINTVEELSEWLTNIFGAEGVRNIIHGDADTAMQFVNVIEAHKQAIYSFYDGIILDNERTGHIKLNISEKEVLDYLENEAA